MLVIHWPQLRPLIDFFSQSLHATNVGHSLTQLRPLIDLFSLPARNQCWSLTDPNCVLSSIFFSHSLHTTNVGHLLTPNTTASLRRFFFSLPARNQCWLFTDPQHDCVLPLPSIFFWLHCSYKLLPHSLWWPPLRLVTPFSGTHTSLLVTFTTPLHVEQRTLPHPLLAAGSSTRS